MSNIDKRGTHSTATRFGEQKAHGVGQNYGDRRKLAPMGSPALPAGSERVKQRPAAEQQKRIDQFARKKRNVGEFAPKATYKSGRRLRTDSGKAPMLERHEDGTTRIAQSAITDASRLKFLDYIIDHNLSSKNIRQMAAAQKADAARPTRPASSRAKQSSGVAGLNPRQAKKTRH